MRKDIGPIVKAKCTCHGTSAPIHEERNAPPGRWQERGRQARQHPRLPRRERRRADAQPRHHQGLAGWRRLEPEPPGDARQRAGRHDGSTRPHQGEVL